MLLLRDANGIDRAGLERYPTKEALRVAANQHVADLYLRGELDALTAGP